MQYFGAFDGDLLLVDRSESVSRADEIIASFTCKQFDNANRSFLSANKSHKTIQIREVIIFKFRGRLAIYGFINLRQN